MSHPLNTPEEVDVLAEVLEDVTYRGRQMAPLEAQVYADRVLRWMAQRGYHRHLRHYLAAKPQPQAYPGGKNGMYDGQCVCGDYSAWPASSEEEAIRRVQEHADAKNRNEELPQEHP